MKRKSIALLFLAFLVVSLLAGCGQNRTANPTQTKKEKREIHIAYQNATTAIILAKSKGWYEEEFSKDGTEVKYNLFISGPPMMEAFAGGRQDVGHTGDMPPVAARAAGIDLKVIGIGGRVPGSSAILVRPDSQIKSVQDLKGKKVAVQVGSATHHFIILLLKQNGLKVSDINLVNLPAPDQKTALETGNVDAVSTWEPWVASLEYANIGKKLIDSSQIIDSVSIYLVRNDFAAQNPDLVERFLKVQQRAVDYIKQNPDEVLELLSKETKFPVPVLSRSLKESDWDIRIRNNDVEVLGRVKDFLKGSNVIKQDYNINDLFDRRYLKGAGIE